MNKKVDLQLLKKLRRQTFAGISLCKEALLENDNDFQKAIRWLKVKGITKGMAKMQRLANEGRCEVLIKNDQAVIFSLNCETDFVVKNDFFQNFYLKLRKIIQENFFKTKEELFAFQLQKQSINDHLLELSGKIGEKISINKYLYIRKTKTQGFAFYNHSNHKSCALLVLNKEDSQDFKEDLAMQVVAMRPRFISFDEISEEFYQKEFTIVLNQINQTHQNKSLEMRQRIAKNKLQKQLCEVIFNEQKFIKNNKKLIKDLLLERGINVLNMYNMEVRK